MHSFVTLGDISPEQFPDNNFENLTVVHKLKYTYEDKTKVDAGYYYLYGDKFVSSQGVIVTGSYFFFDDLAGRASLIFLESKANSEATNLKILGVAPVASGPDLMMRITALYRPVYGKFIFNEHIQRFYLAVEAGINVARERFISTRNYFAKNESEMAYGPLLGIDISIPVSHHLDFSFNAHYFIHKKPFTNKNFSASEEWKSFWGNQLSMGYRF